MAPEGDLKDMAPRAAELPEVLADWLYVARTAALPLRTRHPPESGSPSRRGDPVGFDALLVLV